MKTNRKCTTKANHYNGGGYVENPPKKIHDAVRGDKLDRSKEKPAPKRTPSDVVRG